MLTGKNSAGLTLIELMLSLTLASFIVIAVFTIYHSARRNHGVQNKVHSLQENTAEVSQLIARKIKMAGYLGCANLANHFPLKNNLGFEVSQANALTHYDDPVMKPGSDALSLWYATEAEATLLQTMRTPTVLYTTSNLTFAPGDNIVISDCKTAELVTVKQASLLQHGVQEIVSLQPLVKRYIKNSEVHRMHWEAYFISNTGRFSNHEIPVYALYMENLHELRPHKMELIEGVEQMQIHYVTNEVESLTSDDETSSTIKGVEFTWTLSSITPSSLHKKWYTYVSLDQ